MTTAATRTGSVFAPVTAVYFNADQGADCREFLRTRSANTECVPLVDEAQLVMRADGRLAESGYRFNIIGFEAVGRAVAPGLVALFNDLSGELSRRLVDVDSAEAGVAAAVAIYNTALRVRFETLRERTVLVNHQERSVEGFLGLDHKLLDNGEFFDMIVASLQDRQPEARFHRAEIAGRELRLYFIDPTSRTDALHPNPEHVFASGWYFSNREDVGQAVKGALCIYTKFGVAFEPTTSRSKVVHSGADFFGRTGAMINRVTGRAVDMDAVGRQIKTLLSTPLSFSDNKGEHARALKYWANYLCRLKLRADTATGVVKNAALVGADLRPRGPLEAYSKSVLASRSAYDLLCSALRAAKREYGTYRDALHGVAMQMLMPDRRSIDP